MPKFVHTEIHTHTNKLVFYKIKQNNNKKFALKHGNIGKFQPNKSVDSIADVPIFRTRYLSHFDSLGMLLCKKR